MDDRDPEEPNDEDSQDAPGPSCEDDFAHVPSDKAARQTQPDPEAFASLNQFIFHGNVDASRALIGAAFKGAGGERAPTAVVGRIDDVEIDELIDGYVAPDPHATAAPALAKQKFVVLAGAPLIGKRHAAIKLLREVTQKPLIVLSPTISLSRLASRTYLRGHGYAVIDWCDPDHGLDTGRPASELEWLAVRTNIRRAGAYLVITTVDCTVGDAGKAVPAVRWEPPPPRRLLFRRLGERVGAAEIERTAALVPADCAVSGVLRIAERLAAGKDPQAAVDEVLDLVDREHVTGWFQQKPSRREIVEVVVLALLPEVKDRRFEELLARLEDELAASMPPAQASPAREDSQERISAEEALPQVRSERADASNLIASHSGAGEEPVTFAPRFKEPDYRALVLSELWRRFDSGLWNAVRSWLYEVVQEIDLRLPATAGLVLLATVAPEEVEEQYLEPWSRGAIGTAGQLCAAYALSHLATEDERSTTALHIATRWVSHGNSSQRWTAALVFSGELGARYPTDAVRRLWQLIPQCNDLSVPAALAMGRLFATLVHGSKGAAEVIRLLGERLALTRTVGTTRELRRLILTAIRAVLSERDPVSGRPAVAHFLISRPDQAVRLGALWAAALRNTHHREEAMQALDRALFSLLDVGEARRLADALVRALDANEQAVLRTEAAHLLRNCRKHGRPTDHIQILITVLDEFRSGFRHASEEGP
ncbi:hypothetical protein SMC26_26145 [Actinomadura fulvescens]|uniref:Uncharacterized protein n=1 Tax=Actinomadura fulvescens TaxID=46160 RepID=A0ABN3Q8X4_9ACTN